MKTKIKYSAIALLAVASIFTSCQKSELAPAAPGTPATAIEDNDKSSYRPGYIGEWKVIKYSENGRDLTAQFEGYVVSFREGGKLSAARGSDIFYGTWSKRMGVAGSPLVMSIGTREPVSDLDGRWSVGQKTDNLIELRTATDGGYDYLVLAR